MAPFYVQIFSMTDHPKPFQERYQGKYAGLNGAISTSEMEGGILHLSTQTQTAQGLIEKSGFEEAEVILAYRHTDSGVLEGTSESLISVGKLPWTDLPGLEILKKGTKEKIVMKLWTQEVELTVDRVTRIRFGKTIVYLRNYGAVETFVWGEEKLTGGPAQLHAEVIDADLTIAPPSASGFVVKQGQETTN